MLGPGPGAPGAPQGLTIHTSAPVLIVAGDAAESQGLPLFAHHLWRSARAGGGGVKRSASAASLAARRQPSRFSRPLLLLALLTMGLLSFWEPHVRGGLELALLRARAGMGGAPPPPPRGLDFPVQSCCIGEQCVRASKGRHAVVTHVRSQREVTQLQVRRAPAGWVLVGGRASVWVPAALLPCCCHVACWPPQPAHCWCQPRGSAAAMPTGLWRQLACCTAACCTAPCCSNWRPACAAATPGWTWRSCWCVGAAAASATVPCCQHGAADMECCCSSGAAVHSAACFPFLRHPRRRRSSAAGPARPRPQVRGELGAAATQRMLGMNVTIFYVEPLRDFLGGEPRWGVLAAVAANDTAGCACLRAAHAEGCACRGLRPQAQAELPILLRRSQQHVTAACVPWEPLHAAASRRACCCRARPTRRRPAACADRPRGPLPRRCPPAPQARRRRQQLAQAARLWAHPV